MNNEINRTNSYGAEIFAGQIFSWEDIDRYQFDEDDSECQIISEFYGCGMCVIVECCRVIGVSPEHLLQRLNAM